MKKKLLLLSIITSCFILSAQTLDWAKNMGSSARDAGRFIAVDAVGNIYTTGYFSGTADFDPGVRVHNLTSMGARDMFIQKLDPSGNFIWAKSVGSTGNDEGFAITVDAVANVYISGYFEGTVNFDPNTGTRNLTSSGTSDIFILSLDASGNWRWSKNMGGTGVDQGYAMTVGLSGYVYLAGLFGGTADFDPGPGVTNLTAVGGLDAFVLKLDEGGHLIWARSMGSTATDLATSIAVDRMDNVYTAGYFGNTTDFDPDSITTFNLVSAGRQDIFIQKLDVSGHFVWAKRMGGNLNDVATDIVVDDSANVYTTGYYQSVVDFDPGTGVHNLPYANGSDYFVQKLDTQGDFLWAKGMGGSSQDAGRGLAVDHFGDVYITGRFERTMDFDPGPGIHNLTASGSTIDIFIQKLDTRGDFLWVIKLGSTGVEAGQHMVIDDFGNAYTVGFFAGTVDFDHGAATHNLTSTGNWDIFVHKLGCIRAITATDVVASCNSYTWIDGNTYSANNNTATHLISGGLCDTLMTLDLTISPVNAGISATLPSLTANAVGATYQWLDCNNSHAIVAGATSQSFTPVLNGSYAVAVTENACTDTSVCITIATVDISGNILFKGVAIFPNPTDNLVNINLADLKEVSIKVYSVSGQLVYQKENIRTSSHQFELNAAAGVYIIELNTEQGRQQYKLLKQ